jgi:lysophospholipase L1-like esterase
MRRVLLNATALVISVAVALAIAEVVSRMVNEVRLPNFVNDSGRSQSFFRPDPALGERTEAHLHGWFSSPEYRIRIDTNAAGFRMAEDLAPAKRSKVRVLVLGDSFTFGMGVEAQETYAAVLERMLNANRPRDVEVLNLGVIGYGTLQEIELLHQYAFLEPDVVVLGFFARDVFLAASGNDLEDNYYFAKKLNTTHDDKGPSQQAADLPLSRRLRLQLLWNSNLYRTVELTLGGYLRRRYTPADAPELREEAWHITAAALTQLDRELASRQLPCILLWIPAVGTVAQQDHSVSERLEGLGLKHIQVVDVLDVLRGQEGDAYFNLDSHWNAKGHELAAQALLEPVAQAAGLHSEWAARPR